MMRIQAQAETFAYRVAVHHPDPPHRPHDWMEAPNYARAEERDDLTPEQKAETYHEWNPSHVEGGHVQYGIYPSNHPREQGLHNVTFHGPWLGHKTIEDGFGNTMDHNEYDWRQEESLGKVDHPDKGKALAENHFRENYLGKANPMQGEMDLDSMVKGQGSAPDPFGPKTNTTDDDYGSIF